MIAAVYRAQVELLLRLLPEVATEQAFALKGGTAINLFVRDMPRLSVDIDLTYLALNDRAAALREIADALHRIKDRMDRAVPGISASVVAQSGGQEAKMACRWQNATVMIEVNTIIRGHLWPVHRLPLAQSAQAEFGMFVAATVVSDAELFGGKICAALDRQHPRDLFDVKHLFDNEGLSEEIRLGFVASLLGHTRPMHELLCPNFQDQRKVFDTQFAGMTRKPFTYDDFEATRKRLLHEIHSRLTDDDRSLLLSFKQGDPDWSLFPIDSLASMPAIMWKLTNIRKLQTQNAAKHAEQFGALEKALATRS